MDIIFTIENGEIKHEVVGATDNSCLKLAEPYEQALGTVTNRTLKPEGRIRKGTSTLSSSTKLNNRA